MQKGVYIAAAVSGCMQQTGISRWVLKSVFCEGFVGCTCLKKAEEFNDWLKFQPTWLFGHTISPVDVNEKAYEEMCRCRHQYDDEY